MVFKNVENKIIYGEVPSHKSNRLNSRNETIYADAEL